MAKSKILGLELLKGIEGVKMIRNGVWESRVAAKYLTKQ